MFAERRRRVVPALIALVAASAGCGSLTGPSATDDAWVVHDSPHFVLHVRPGSFGSQHAATFAEVLEEQREVSLTRLGAALDAQLYGFFYEPGQGGLRSLRAGVAYPLNRTFTLVAAPPLDGNLYVLMSHEANHVIVEQVLGRPGTSFVNEGLASALLSERFHQLGPVFLHAWVAARSDLPPLSRLIDDDEWSRMGHDEKYNSSASFLAYLLDVFGPEPLKEIYGASSKDFPDRFQRAYGIGLTEMEQRWKAFVRGAEP